MRTKPNATPERPIDANSAERRPAADSKVIALHPRALNDDPRLRARVRKVARALAARLGRSRVIAREMLGELHRNGYLRDSVWATGVGDVMGILGLGIACGVRRGLNVYDLDAIIHDVSIIESGPAVD